MKDLTTISTDLFNKVRSRFSNVKLGDRSGKVITDPAQARFFDLNFTHNGDSLGQVNIKVDEDSLTVIYSESMVEGQNSVARNDWYGFLKELRMFAKSNMLTFDTRDITKTNLDKRDYEYLAQENGDIKMSESKLWGTSKTSFQDMGEARIIVKHSQPVNYALPAGRTMHIDSIYIENADGERFRYPHRHLNGARAMAVHVANGGTVYDQIGTHIGGLSEELSKLRQFKNYTQRNGLQEALNDVSELVLTRISDIKEQIAKLQRQSYYQEFAESFAPVQDLPIPEETINNWVDALTIRTFNEELKSVFPFIYKLTSQPKALGYEDLVDEGKKCNMSEEGKMCPVHGMKECGMYEGQDDYCDACDRPESDCVCNDKDLEEHNHLEDFENHLENIATFEYDTEVVEEPNEGNEFAMKVQQLKAQGAKPGTKFTTSDGEEHTLKDAIEAFGMTLEDFWSEDELAEMQMVQSPNSREVVEFILSMYDQERGTFPKGEEGVKIAVEKRFGEQAGQFAGQVVERLSVVEHEGPNFELMNSAIQEAADASSAAELKAAIEKFQQAAGIKVDGKFGPETSKALQTAAGAAPAPGGANPATGVNAQGQNVSIKNPDGSTTNPETGKVTPATATAKAPATAPAAAPTTGNTTTKTTTTGQVPPPTGGAVNATTNTQTTSTQSGPMSTAQKAQFDKQIADLKARAGMQQSPTGQTTTTQSFNIANEPVVPGKPLSQQQMAVMGMALRSGNQYPPEVMAQYNKQKGAATTASAPTQQGGNAGNLGARDF